MIRALVLATLALALVAAGQRPAGLGDVRDVSVVEYPDHTRVVVELSRGATYRTNRIADPPRLYLDIDGVWIEERERAERAPAAPGPVSKVRGGQNTLERARVVIELAANRVTHRVFHIEDPPRIIVDVFPAASGGGEAPPAVAGNAPGNDFAVRPVQRVVIDPGHGGQDPGANGRGVREKDVVLAIARELRGQLERSGLEVHLTREGDVYLPLEERTARANRLDADLFVSIHANASPNRKTQGVETYLLDTRYDRQTARVAARENGTTIGELSEVQRILASLRLGYNERYAAPLAERVHGALLGRLRRNHGPTRDLGVKRGPFLVLFMANMPAVLVEVGFLSNREEARRLGSRNFARAAAAGIADGILAYRGEHARRLVAGR
jgi:N-acetylmuramoyl-L-alanine amidase